MLSSLQLLILGYSERLDLSPSAALPTVNVAKSDTLKLSFTVVDDEDDTTGVRPHQAFLRFYASSGEEGIQPIKVSSTGKAKFELVRPSSLHLLRPHVYSTYSSPQNPRRPPAGLPATTESTILSVDLILGSFTHASSIIPLMKLTVPPSLPVAPHPEEHLYHPKPLLHHTFREEQRMPNKAISTAFVGIALAPWAVLLALVRLPPSLLPNAFPF